MQHVWYALTAWMQDFFLGVREAWGLFLGFATMISVLFLAMHFVAHRIERVVGRWFRSAAWARMQKQVWRLRAKYNEEKAARMAAEEKVHQLTDELHGRAHVETARRVQAAIIGRQA